MVAGRLRLRLRLRAVRRGAGQAIGVAQLAARSTISPVLDSGPMDLAHGRSVLVAMRIIRWRELSAAVPTLSSPCPMTTPVFAPVVSKPRLVAYSFWLVAALETGSPLERRSRACLSAAFAADSFLTRWPRVRADRISAFWP